MDYQYIIVGAGSAGCVLAARLIERSAGRVLLIEAGPADHNPFIHMPGAVAKAIERLTWDYTSEPDPHTGNRRLTVAQGKVLGGSSSVNGMIYIRGQQADFDRWAHEYGCSGWSYADLLPHFRRAEANESLSDAWHGDSGPLPVSENRYRHPLSMAFVRAGQQLGLPYVNDFNGASQAGVGFYQTTTRNGARASTARTYLEAVRTHPRLTILTNALVERVIIEQACAVGVVYQLDGKRCEARASEEVILSAGANASPKLLMLSGIGPAAHLREHGIDCHADLPVGKNWHDHLHLSINATLRQPISLYGQDKGLAALRNGAQWALTRSGVLTSNILEGAAFVDTHDTGTPDVQVHFLPVLDTWDDPDGLGKGRTHGLTLKVGHLQPRSRGAVQLRSSDPSAPVRIVGNLLHDPADVAGQVRAVRLGLQWLQMPALAGQLREVFSPAPRQRDDAGLEAFVRNTCKTVYHPVGSCRMGSDPHNAVVGLDLRVHGIDGLRVVDGSVFPQITSGNTNAPVIAVAEKAADLLLGSPLAVNEQPQAMPEPA